MADDQGAQARALHYAIDWTGSDSTVPFEKLLELGVRSEHLEDFDKDKMGRVPTVYSTLWQIAVAHHEKTGSLVDVQVAARNFKQGTRAYLADQLGLDPQAVTALASLAYRAARAERGNGSDAEGLAAELLEHFEDCELLTVLHTTARAHGKMKARSLLTYMMDQGTAIQRHSGERQRIRSVRDSSSDRVFRYEDLEAHPEKALGTPTGFTAFDERTGGLYPGEVMLVTGITKIGKSLLRERIIANAWLAGYNVADVLSEMYAETAQLRLECMELSRRGVDVNGGMTLSRALKQARLPAEAKEAYYGMLGDFAQSHSDIFFVEPGSYENLDDLEARIAQLKQRYDIRVLGVDDIHSQVLRTFQNQREDLKQGEIVDWLKKIAQRYHLAVIGEVQEDRSTARSRYVIWSEVVKYSARLTQKCDIGVRLFRTENAVYPELQVLAHRQENDENFRFRIHLDKDRLLIGDAPSFVTEEHRRAAEGVYEAADDMADLEELRA